MGLGYDKDDTARRLLAGRLTSATDGAAPFPDDLRERVARTTGAPADAVDTALKCAGAPLEPQRPPCPLTVYRSCPQG